MNYQKGFIVPLLLALIALLILAGGAYVYVQNKQTTSTTMTPEPQIYSGIPFNALPNHYDNNNAVTWYWAQNGVIYCMNSIVASADSATFVALYSYGKDKNHVYRCDSIVEKADTTSFIVLDHWYAKDRNYVFDNGNIMSGADPASFEVMNLTPGYESYRKDKNLVYNHGQEILGADPATFGPVLFRDGILSGFLKDKNNVYDGNHGSTTTPNAIVPDADPTTFSEDDTGIIARDKNHVYFLASSVEGVILVPEADPKTFMFLGSVRAIRYCKDVNHIYFCDSSSYKFAEDIPKQQVAIIPMADLASFAVSTSTQSYDAYDKNHKYFAGNIVQ